MNMIVQTANFLEHSTIQTYMSVQVKRKLTPSLPDIVQNLVIMFQD